MERQCPVCGEPIFDDSLKYCPGCGTELPTDFGEETGEEIFGSEEDMEISEEENTEQGNEEATEINTEETGGESARGEESVVPSEIPEEEPPLPEIGETEIKEEPIAVSSMDSGSNLVESEAGKNEEKKGKADEDKKKKAKGKGKAKKGKKRKNMEKRRRRRA